MTKRLWVSFFLLILQDTRTKTINWKEGSYQNPIYSADESLLGWKKNIFTCFNESGKKKLTKKIRDLIVEFFIKV